MKAMSKDPRDRYESVSELFERHRRFLSGAKVEAAEFQ